VPSPPQPVTRIAMSVLAHIVEKLGRVAPGRTTLAGLRTGSKTLAVRVGMDGHPSIEVSSLKSGLVFDFGGRTSTKVKIEGNAYG